ncbi:MAG: glycosyl hydrolase 53 family protein [Erysipelotrichaceae bacterium]|nr:glycosyl hydrolase 53 family protein [Erysipelotrichaceae bacterium]
MIKGFDMSALARIYELGGKYYENGEEKNAIEIVKNNGANLIRLRIFNDPYSINKKEYGGGICDISYLKRNVDYCEKYQIPYLLDFHYSDFWADPGKQTMPKAWIGKSVDELVEEIYDFTYFVLNNLSYRPTMVQIGNEITNGMLWPIGDTEHFDNLVSFVNSGIKAVNDFDSNIKTMIHLDNGTNEELYDTWFEKYFNNGGMDFDYIGMSYYQIWNKGLRFLEDNIIKTIDKYHKKVIIAETSYPFTIDDYKENIPDNQRKGMALKKELIPNLEFDISRQGQCDYFDSLGKLIKRIDDLEGFIYWGSELIPYDGSGWATYEGIEYVKEKGPLGNEWANQAIFDYDGQTLPVLNAIKKL